MRLRLIKIAARVVEGAARIRVFLPTACPDRDVFRALAGRLCAAGLRISAKADSESD
jgi:hypothetical protein